MTLLDLPKVGSESSQTMATPTYVAVPLNLGCQAYGVEQGPFAVWREVQARAAPRPLDPQLDVVRNLRLVTVPSPGQVDFGTADFDPVVSLAAIAQTCERLAGTVADAARSGAPLVTVGGDHTMAIGTVAGLRRVYDRVGVLWIDAHADLNTWTESPSRHAHGMVTAAILGRPGTPAELLGVGPSGAKVAHDNLVMLGVRDLDWGEKAYLRAHPEMRVNTMDDIEGRGIASVTKHILDYLEQRQLDAVHVSFDIDAIDPDVAPGTGVPVPGGLSEREALYLVGAIARNRGRVPVRSFEVAEVNPALDRQHRTSELAARLVCRFLGEEAC